MAFDPRSIHYGVDGERYGPVDLAELRRLLAEGRVGPDDYLWDEDHQDWIALKRYPVLFEETTGTDDDEGVHDEFEPVDADHPSTWRVRADLPYAGFGIRFLAWILDDLVLLLPALVWVLTVENQSGMEFVEIWAAMMRGDALNGAEQQFLQQVQLGIFVLRGIYWATMESSRWQGTVGKRITGLVVCDERGYRISFRRALVRYFGRILCEFTFGAGYLLIFFSRRRQGLHDTVARTTVMHGR